MYPCDSPHNRSTHSRNPFPPFPTKNQGGRVKMKDTSLGFGVSWALGFVVLRLRILDPNPNP